MILTLACASTSVELERDSPSSDVEGVEGREWNDTGDREEADFFDDSFIHAVAIELSEDAEDALRDDPYTYVEGAVSVDGDVFPRVGVRLRGKVGSFRSLNGKPKFKIDFNRYDDDQRLGPYETLALNNEVVDCSYLREPTGYAVFRALGLPAPRTVFSLVTVNGEEYGLYVALEFPDDVFLADRYADGSGNLYDGKYLYWGNGSYEMVDFTPDLVDNFRLEEGTEVGGADVEAIVDALQADGSFAQRIEPVLDTEEFHRHVLGEQWIGQLDGYALNKNNYRVYFDPEDGRADLLTYDLDYAFYTAATWGMDWGNPEGAIVRACWRDAECIASHAAAVETAVAAFDNDALVARFDAWVALIAEEAADDRRRECDTRQVEPAQASMREWVVAAPDALLAYWR